MLRLKIFQRTELEQTPPSPQYLEIDEERYKDQLFLLPIATAAKGVQLLLATHGPNAPLPLDTDIQKFSFRRIVCTHPEIAGEVVIDFPNPNGYLSN